MSTSLSHGKSDSSPLLAKVLDAHGGLENWERVRALRADIVLGGPFWSMLGWPHAELKLTASLDARREHITLAPFTAPDRVAVFDVEPERLSIHTTDGVLVEQRDDPRSSFPPFDLGTTGWDQIQVAYFLSAAHWNYLTQPFSFTYPGVEVREIEPWDEGGETWRRLAVRFPETNANHNADQLSITTPTSCCAAWTTHPRSPPTRRSRTTPTIPTRLMGSSSRRAGAFTAATLMASPTTASR